MLHFGVQPHAGHVSVWGLKVTERDADPAFEIQQAMALTSWVTTVGQGLGGIGIYRTATGQPQNMVAGGAYTFDTYLTTYLYAQGQYSFALEVQISLAETLNLSDAVTPALILQQLLAEGLTLGDTVTAPYVANVSFTEALTLTDTIAVSAVYGILLPESLLISDSISINAALVAYVVNANTGAVSTYTNYNFNSFAKLDGRYFGATDAGIYELTGTDDAGTAIDASVVLPTTDFPTDQVSADLLKRLPTVYLGVNTTGGMMLKVTANGADNFYTLAGTTTTSLHTGRMLLGKGVAARYWDFELTNVDGADFTLESISFYPVALTRRIVRG